MREGETNRGGRVYQGMYTRFSSESHEVNGPEERGEEMRGEKEMRGIVRKEEEIENWRQEKQRKKKKHHRDKNREEDSVRASMGRKHKHKHKKRSDRADKESERSLARYS